MLAITIIITIIGIGILAAAHEIAHYLVARALGIKVYELSVFVGPKLFHWERKGVEYNLRLIPFGAYVRFSDYEEEDDDESNEDPRYILNQPRWKRLFVSLAGPIMNIVLGVVILAVLFSVSGFYTTIQNDVYPNTQMEGTAVEPGDRIISINGTRVYTEYDLYAELTLTDPTEDLNVGFHSQKTGDKYNVLLVPDKREIFRIGISHMNELTEEGGWSVVAIDPRQNGGDPVILENDIILTVNGIPVSDPEIDSVITHSDGSPLSVELIRGETDMEVEIKPFVEETVNSRGFDLRPGQGVLEAMREAVVFPAAMFRLTVFSIRSVFQGDLEPYNVVSGPVGMVTIVSDVVSEPDVDNSVKTESLVMIAAVISIGLAFTNLLPLPGLDGNEIIMLIIETIRGKKMSKRSERVISVIGFVIILMLVSLALTSDIIRLLV